MKRIFVLPVVLLLAALPLQAQSLMFRGGVNVSTLSGDAVTNAASENGLNYGLGLVIPLGSVDLDLGLSFTEKGGQTTDGLGAATWYLDYVEIPILVRLGPDMPGPLGVHLLVGPTLGFESDCQVSLTGSTTATPCSGANFDVKKADWGAAGGAGAEFSAGTMTLGLDVFYDLGLLTIDNSGTSDIKNRAWTVRGGIGISF
ncbi:MAG: PorT family protein [Gemmatimonadota bacterium]|nr:PorT family protein [Gemmatimonadota bacterium]